MRKIRAGGSPGRSFLILAGPDAAVCTTATLEHGLSHGTQGSVRLRAPRSGAQTVWAQRVPGGARKALLKDRGNKSLRRRLGECAPRRGGHAGSTFAVQGGGNAASKLARAELSVMKPAGKQVSQVEKKCDLYQCLYMYLYICLYRDMLPITCTSVIPVLVLVVLPSVSQ